MMLTPRRSGWTVASAEGAAGGVPPVAQAGTNSSASAAASILFNNIEYPSRLRTADHTGSIGAVKPFRNAFSIGIVFRAGCVQPQSGTACCAADRVRGFDIVNSRKLLLSGLLA